MDKTNCWYCGNEMIWNCDFDFDDYGIEGKGIVTTLSCPQCEATAEFYTKVEK